MDEHLEKTMGLLSMYTDQQPSADAILIACQISALVDAMQRVGNVLSYIDDGIDEANRLNEQRLNRGM